jgi:hypothetical protein
MISTFQRNILPPPSTVNTVRVWMQPSDICTNTIIVFTQNCGTMAPFGIISTIKQNCKGPFSLLTARRQKERAAAPLPSHS